jgi:hypothetical protein
MLRARVPEGWFVKESFTLLAPDGQANIIVSREPLDPGLTTEQYARIQGDLLRREFPGYTERALTLLPLAVGAAYLRLFSWRPPDGVPVTQHQVYFASSGVGYTATATTPSTNHARYAAVFDEVLGSLVLGPAAPPVPPPPVRPATPSFPPPGPAPVTGGSRPAQTVVGRRSDLAPPAPPPPEPRQPAAPERYLWAAVDRVLVAAVDVADARARGPVPGEPDDADEQAVRAALDAVLGATPELPWHGDPDVEARVRTRIAAWAAGARRLAVATDPGDPARTTDLLWTAAGLVAAAALGARRTGDEDSGLATVLGRVRDGLPEPEGAWDEELATVVVVRPTRYRLRTVLEAGSGRLVRAGNAATQTRWGQVIDHHDLPLPVSLADRIDFLLQQFDAGLEWKEGDPPSVMSKRDAFGNGYGYVLRRLREALGPAYQVLDSAQY